MTRSLGRRGGKPWSRADSRRPDDTKKPEVGAGPKQCHGALAPLPNVWRQWRAQRVHCTPGLGRVMRLGRIEEGLEFSTNAHELEWKCDGKHDEGCEEESELEVR